MVFKTDLIDAKVRGDIINNTSFASMALEKATGQDSSGYMVRQLTDSNGKVVLGKDGKPLLVEVDAVSTAVSKATQDVMTGIATVAAPGVANVAAGAATSAGTRVTSFALSKLSTSAAATAQNILSTKAVQIAGNTAVNVLSSTANAATQNAGGLASGIIQDATDDGHIDMNKQRAAFGEAGTSILWSGVGNGILGGGKGPNSLVNQGVGKEIKEFGAETLTDVSGNLYKLFTDKQFAKEQGVDLNDSVSVTQYILKNVTQTSLQNSLDAISEASDLSGRLSNLYKIGNNESTSSPRTITATLANPTGAATPAAIGTPSTPASLTNPTGAPVGRSGVDTGVTPRTQTTGADKVATVARDIAQAPVTGATTPVTSTNGPVVPGQTSTTGARVSQPVVDAGVKTNASTPASLTNPTGAATPAAIGTPSTPASLTNPTGAPVGRSGVDTGVTPRTQTTGADKVATVARDIAQAPVTGATTPVTSTNGPVVPGQTSTTGARVSQPVVDAGVKTNASTPASLTNPTGAATPAAIGTPSTPASLTNPTGAPVGRSGVDTGVTPRTQTTGADKVATVARDIAQAPVTGATTPVTSTNGPVVPGQTSTTGARVSQPVVDAGVKTNASTPASLTNPTGAATPAAIGTPSRPLRASRTRPARPWGGPGLIRA